MTIGELEVAAGIEDRAAFWEPFAKIRGTIRRGHKRLDAGLEAGIEALRKIAEERGNG